jgi:hypothetical protein
VMAGEQGHWLRLDQAPLSRPGSVIHQYRGVEDGYAIRRSDKARRCLNMAPNTVRRILRVDARHDSTTTEHRPKTRYRHYADPTSGRGGPK